jgi:hypothetical protein
MNFLISSKYKDIYKKQLETATDDRFDLYVLACMKNACKTALLTKSLAKKLAGERKEMVTLYTDIVLNGVNCISFTNYYDTFLKQVGVKPKTIGGYNHE